ncbi:MAG: exodeoxyribonuclease VII small subunit [SAR202 cluster bacterium]|jgi:exodeoxyribonuclease VII small subunit|nr:exodeoxyribonuclease VII small subunit [SAR202 cluster bacterium]MDP6300060.1 exodeoxyribonuclease VII small subunit [SAR202 cluster bacterium]MDP7102694.1 exodeoxyribonuclease VII small subunit [SAR202 cluster bacterium]MDP7224477.1 exodeoxyribonuclease VII small subunit [SAR202 cluster bacterium]MDP7413490.1 exodeoxyribonuclease VII small subunit [SAR202 cluster bacterium]|tara:strand:- start:2688 stop:2975 length:288 start_codon:yes stop_codon:yes gene_type:complete
MSASKPDDTSLSDAKLEDLSFEDSMKLLEETVASLEAGGLNLAEATQRYKQGVKLARLCSEMLASTELTITRIQTAYGEQMRFLSDSGDDPDDDE